MQTFRRQCVYVDDRMGELSGDENDDYGQFF
jgi:hypothetical protein